MLKVSIITPSYNQGEFIEETINSVINQNYENIEYIIIDGGSTDNTLNIIYNYKNRIDYFVSKPDNGQCDAINKGLKKSTGDIFGWLNSDDYYTPNALTTIVKAFTDNPDWKVIVGAGKVIDEYGNQMFIKSGIGISPDELLKKGIVPLQPSVFFKREVTDRIGFLREDLHLVLDWEYWIRMGLNLPKQSIGIINDILSVAREYGNNKTSIGLLKVDESGMLKNDAEKKMVLDDLFNNKHSLPLELANNKKVYYQSFYLNKAVHNFKAGLNAQVRVDFYNAFKIDPLRSITKRNILIFLSSFIGYRKLIALKMKIKAKK